MKRLKIALILYCVLLIHPASADVALVTPQVQGGIEFVTGGVDVEEYKAMRAIQGNYNLHLLFAANGTGEYLADVMVKIMTSSGKTILDTVSEGAYLYAKLPPGHYSLIADSDGHVIKKTISVSNKHGVLVPLYFPQKKGD
ncbi:carboxypeptidase regulatory-like domain-containing protein [Methyloterricola oryzae]|uniref:carboxypeptidase regulatory-like domain-containing protein n=1 Tax=Methyloterricola oryzae TaxID=1495050 RepID=UPI0005EB67B1|nr:carboxypeptidase regulatory-like domain-containing protein [Methyloterricola oryzae]